MPTPAKSRKSAKSRSRPQETTGTRLGREARTAAQKLTPAQRKAAHATGMRLIYGSDPRVEKALAMVAESRPRMNRMTETQLHELEADARARMAAGSLPTPRTNAVLRGIDRSTQPPTANEWALTRLCCELERETIVAQREAAVTAIILKNLLADLPAKRNWLDPDVEQVIRSLVARAKARQ